MELVRAFLASRSIILRDAGTNRSFWRHLKQSWHHLACYAILEALERLLVLPSVSVHGQCCRLALEQILLLCSLLVASPGTDSVVAQRT